MLRIKNEVNKKVVLPKDENGQILSDSPDNIAFLAIDSDRSAFRNHYGSAVLSEKECVHIDGYNIQQQLHDIKEADPNGSPFSWVDRDLKEFHGIDGACCVRQFGRLMLFNAIDKICCAVKNAENAALHAGNINRLQIFVLTGIGGGTGSRIFLDMAYILRNLASQYCQHVDVKGFIFTPDVISYSHNIDMQIRQNMYANGFAALKELDYWMSTGEHGHKFDQIYNDRFR